MNSLAHRTLDIISDAELESLLPFLRTVVAQTNQPFGTGGAEVREALPGRISGGTQHVPSRRVRVLPQIAGDGPSLRQDHPLPALPNGADRDGFGNHASS